MKKIWIMYILALCLITLSSCSNKHEHEKGGWEIERAATCTKEGLKKKYCLICDEEIKSAKIPKIDHEYIDGVCKMCGALNNSNEHIHQEEVIPGYDATCTENGLTEGKKCSICNEILVEPTVILAQGHDYEEGTCTKCGKMDSEYIAPVNCALDRNNESCLDPVTWSWDYNKDNWDGKGMTIEIMVLPVSEYDPGDSQYLGERKQEKRQVIARVESEYNIDIVYKDYPIEAPWGPERINWISKGVIAGDDVGDIFLIDSSWIPTLQKNNAIAELYNTKTQKGIFADYNYEQNEYYNLMSMKQNRIYGYATGEVYPDYWLHYNQRLIDQYNLPDPAKLWNNNEWTWSAFMDLLEKAQAAFNQNADKGQKWAFGGEYFEVAKGFVAARGGQFVKNGLVLLENATVIQVYEDLQDIEDLYWEPNGSTVSTANFRDGLVLFQTGSMWFYGDAERWPTTLDFGISAVPYPRMDDDPDLMRYNIPVGYESMFAIRNVVSGENGLNASILFNILDDITNGLRPESTAIPGGFPSVNSTKNYYSYLEARLATVDSLNAIMDVVFEKEGLTYFEMIDIVSFAIGDGSHYSEYGIYPKSSSIIRKEENQPIDILGQLQPIYQAKLDELLGAE